MRCGRGARHARVTPTTLMGTPTAFGGPAGGDVWQGCPDSGGRLHMLGSPDLTTRLPADYEPGARVEGKFVPKSLALRARRDYTSINER